MSQEPRPPRRRRTPAPPAGAASETAGAAPDLGPEAGSLPAGAPSAGRRKRTPKNAPPAMTSNPPGPAEPAAPEAEPESAGAATPRRRRTPRTAAPAARPSLSDPTPTASPTLEPEPAPKGRAADLDLDSDLDLDLDPDLDSQVGWELSPLARSGLPKVAVIARRELGAYFVSPIGYVVAAVLMIVVSLLGYLSQIVLQSPIGMDSVFSLFALLMVFFTPLYTMRLLAEERRSGTLELLLTTPVRDWEVVVGKWLAGLVFYLATAAFTLVYPVLIAIYDPVRTHYLVAGHQISIPGLDPGPLLTGYLGLILVGAAWVALGLLASSLTSNQIIAAIIGIGLLVFFEYLAGALGLVVPGQMSNFFNYLSAGNRAQSFSQGRLVAQDVVYFLSLVLGSLLLSARVLESRRWSR